jgi:hypothetical protein
MSDLLNSASLVMIPSGYKEDVVYSVVPTDGSGDLSFTRASNGTRVNSAGLVEVVAWNLLEDSETLNLWATNNSPTITANNLTAPNGTLTADTFQTSASISGVFKVGIVVSGSVYTFTVYIKNVSSATSLIIGCDSNPSNASLTYNAVTNTITSVGGGITSSSVQDAGNGWYRVSGTYVSTGSANAIIIYSGASSSMTFGAWGAQLNIGSTAKPYFPTTDRLNVPRLTYQNGGGGCPSLLLEKQSTNYMPYSQDISLWYAPADGVTLTSNTTDTLSPDGTNNASKIAIVSGSKRSYEITNSVAGVGTFSAYVKAGTSTSITLFTSSGSINIGYNLSTLAITTGSGTGTITSVGNGWYRITATNTLGASEVLQVLYTGTAGQTIYIWGFQVEAGSYVTSYIFTNGASATRVADACFKTGISSLFGTNQGTFFIDFVYYGSEQFSYLFDVSDSANTNRFLMYDSNGSGLYYFYDSVYSQITTVQFTKGQRYKIAVKYNSSGTIWYLNGVLSATGTVSFAYQMSQVYLGVRYSLTDNTGMQINQTIVFPTALSGTDLIALTTI